MEFMYAIIIGDTIHTKSDIWGHPIKNNLDIATLTRGYNMNVPCVEGRQTQSPTNN